MYNDDEHSGRRTNHMIQRFEPTALQSTRATAVAAIERAMPAAGSTLALPQGEIAGDFRASGRVDNRRRPIYELLIANDTAAPIATFAYALDGRTQSRVTWDAIIVPAHSAVAVDIDVAVRPRGREPRMIAEVYTLDSKLVIDAKGDAGITRAVARRAIATVAGMAVVLTGSLAYAAMRPHVAALVAPQTVASGASFDVAYDARGSSATYSVDTPDGVEVASGTLDPRAGSFSVALPHADVSLGYDVSVAAAGPLGNDSRTIHVVALAPVNVASTNVPAVNVTHVSVERDAVDGGQPIVVRYRSTVPGGNVRLIDQYGTVRGEALLSSRGRSTLVAPYVDADQDLRVVVNAQRGDEHASAAVPVTVRHVAAPAEAALATAAAVPALAARPNAPAATNADTAQQSAADNPEDAAATAAQPRDQNSPAPTIDDNAEPVVVLPGPPISVDPHQVAGQPVRVSVLHHDAGLHLSMMAPGGAELVSENVSPSVTSVLLEAPTQLVDGGKGYSIVATFSRGVGQETVIRPISFSK
jgi:hypothetical protein